MDGGIWGSQRELLRRQAGVISRQQALALGMTPKAIVVRLRSGRWQRLYPGVYAAFSGEPPRAALLWAAVLRTGPFSALSHETAAELHGLLDQPSPVIHVTVPRGRPVISPAGVEVHYSGRLAESKHPALAPPRTRLEDSVLDLVTCAGSLDEAVSLVLRAIGRRRTTAIKIPTAMAGRSRMRWRADITQALGEAAGGVHSLLEYRYIVRVERPHGLPRGRRQRPVQRGGRRQYQDVSYDDFLTVVELDGSDRPPVRKPLEGHTPRQRQRGLRHPHPQVRIPGRVCQGMRNRCCRGRDPPAPRLGRRPAAVWKRVPGLIRLPVWVHAPAGAPIRTGGGYDAGEGCWSALLMQWA